MARKSKLHRFAGQIAGKLSRGKPPSLTPEMAAYLDERTDRVTDTLDGFLRQLGKNTEESESLAAAYIMLLEIQLEYLRYRVDRGFRQAKEVLSEFERRLVSLVRSGELPGPALSLVTGAMREAKLQPSADLLAVSEELLHREAMAEPDDPAALLEQFAGELGGDAFELLDAMGKAMHAMPADVRSVIAAQMSASEVQSLRDAAAIAILDSDSAVRRRVATSLLAHADALSPTAVRRLIAVRNWIPDNERDPIDQAVRSARSKGVECGPWEPGEATDIRASAVDGSGAHGLLVVSPAGKKYRFSSILLKEGVGVLDAWTGAPERRREITWALKSAENDLQFLAVSRAYLDRVVGHYLAVGLANGAVSPAGLLQVAEVIGATDWQPAELDWREMLEGLIAQLPSPALAPAKVQDVVETSAVWAASMAVTQSWFEDDQEVQDVMHKAGARRFDLLSRRVLCDILEPKKLKWAERFVWTACWLREGLAESGRLWPRFAILARELVQGRRTDTIPLMAEIAYATVAASEVSD